MIFHLLFSWTWLLGYKGQQLEEGVQQGEMWWSIPCLLIVGFFVFEKSADLVESEKHKDKPLLTPNISSIGM